jgi:hypothetical protein
MRIWGNDALASQESYYFDLIDQSGRPIIIPAGWKILSVPKGFIPYQRVRSLEYELGCDLEKLTDGERYIAPEGVQVQFIIPSERNVLSGSQGGIRKDPTLSTMTCNHLKLVPPLQCGSN